MLFQINAKESLRIFFDTIWTFIWVFKWYVLAIIAINLIVFVLDRLLKIRIFRIVFVIFLILAVAAFFIWLYS